MRLTPAAAALVLITLAWPAFAQPPAVTQASPSAQAYYEFMMARRLEADGDSAGALAALERAQKLDPGSAEILAERAALHARRNEAGPARDAAEKALAIDQDNVEAHRILGLVFSAWSEGAAPPPPGETPDSLRSKALEHLKKAARGTDNTMPYILEAARAYCTLYEIRAALEEVFGAYREPVFF